MERSAITPALASRLIATQFPQWASLPVYPVEVNGHDNVTFRLGQSMSVRLPAGDDYVPQVGKEHRWLPELARQLPLAIPQPIAMGAPGCGYPWPWSVYQWLDGEPAAIAQITDLPQFAADLAGFLAALYKIESTGGPPAGYETCFFGVPLTHWDSQTRQSITMLSDEIDAQLATDVWEAALAAPADDPAVWFHGDVSPGNLLVSHGRLSAVIDFGVAGVGDPACDTAITWTFFSGESRSVYSERLPASEATWARGRGWALWKALITLALAGADHPREAAHARGVIRTVLAEHQNLA
ncbi:MAG TPA: aminoglycoside phosphotransferase family protein [Streptosporangiaceae bacterium]|nr:aminoglycoside phosphotransferase family protein [Streptosporangiaceae bacterium]